MLHTSTGLLLRNLSQVKLPQYGYIANTGVFQIIDFNQFFNSNPAYAGTSGTRGRVSIDKATGIDHALVVYCVGLSRKNTPFTNSAGILPRKPRYPKYWATSTQSGRNLGESRL